MVQDALVFYNPDKGDRNWDRMQSRIAYLESERAKALDEIDHVKDYIDEINEEINELIFES
ncbi:TrwK protein [Leuconostoc gelidum subsp. aenigmaticum]|uniref:TrwK protein n=1 Tax=Leuconostoc gelidum TaxID=1244 RepID=UPI001CC67BA9|nr:TrwK protein [Leuconostoc gelidum]MBZ6004074.1 TrwK protein [Leuconostoc gelidum subsp. aenigmaticum]